MECSLILPAPVVVLNLAFFTVGVPVTVAPIIVWQRRGLLRPMPTSRKKVEGTLSKGHDDAQTQGASGAPKTGCAALPL